LGGTSIRQSTCFCINLHALQHVADRVVTDVRQYALRAATVDSLNDRGCVRGQGAPLCSHLPFIRFAPSLWCRRFTERRSPRPTLAASRPEATPPPLQRFRWQEVIEVAFSKTRGFSPLPRPVHRRFEVASQPAHSRRHLERQVSPTLTGSPNRAQRNPAASTGCQPADARLPPIPPQPPGW
jgi:hypothetical protein